MWVFWLKGVLEAYYTTDADVMKDSNLELTMVPMFLNRALEILTERGMSMPERLPLAYDKTAWEGKRNAWQSGRRGWWSAGSSAPCRLGTSK